MAWNNVDTDDKWQIPDRLLDMQKSHICCPSPKFISVLCTRNELLVFLSTLTCKGDHLGIQVYGDGGAWKMTCPVNWQLKRWWLAPWTNNSVLWSCQPGRGWILGLPHPHLYAKSHDYYLIRLQALMEIVTNETAKALNWLAKQHVKMQW